MGGVSSVMWEDCERGVCVGGGGDMMRRKGIRMRRIVICYVWGNVKCCSLDSST